LTAIPEAGWVAQPPEFHATFDRTPVTTEEERLQADVIDKRENLTSTLV